MKLPPYLQQEGAGSLLVHLRVQPGASHPGWAGLHGQRLKIRISSPPREGKANRELVLFLSAALGIPRSQIELVRGRSSRDKTVRISGLPADQLLTLLPLP